MVKTLLLPALLALHSAALHASPLSASVNCFGTTTTSTNPALVDCNWTGEDIGQQHFTSVESRSSASATYSGNTFDTRASSLITYLHPGWTPLPGPLSLRSISSAGVVTEGPLRTGIARITLVMSTGFGTDISGGRYNTALSLGEFSGGREIIYPNLCSFSGVTADDAIPFVFTVGPGYCKYDFSAPTLLGAGAYSMRVEMDSAVSLSSPRFGNHGSGYYESRSDVSISAQFFEADGITPVNVYDPVTGIPVPTPEPGTMSLGAVAGVVALLAQRRLRVV